MAGRHQGFADSLAALRVAQAIERIALVEHLVMLVTDGTS